MKKIYCDLCKKEIRPEDLHTELPLNIGNKHFDIDMHSACYYKFIQALREENRRLRNERNLTYKNLYEDLIKQLVGGRA